MKAYLDDMDILEDVLDDQMDWECWPVDDEIEDFGLDLASDSSPPL